MSMSALPTMLDVSTTVRTPLVLTTVLVTMDLNCHQIIINVKVITVNRSRLLASYILKY